MLVEKEKHFRNILKSIFPGPKTKKENNHPNSNVSSFNELNPMDIDEKAKLAKSSIEARSSYPTAGGRKSSIIDQRDS